jgi:hypothetical protein
MEHEHMYTEDHSLSTLNRARYLYSENIKDARFVEEASSREAIE